MTWHAPVLIQILYAALRGRVSLVAPDHVMRESLAENMMLRQHVVWRTAGLIHEYHAVAA